MKCQSCSNDVAIFSAEWQSQRDSAVKKCPSCGREVEAVLGARPFFTWFILSGIVIAGIALAVGSPLAVAILYGATSGLLFAVFPSFQLRAPLKPTGVRSVLNKSIDLPQWLEPAPWARSVGRAMWAAGSLLVMAVAVSLGVPAPWSGFLLAGLGALGIWRREVHMSWFKLAGGGAVAYAASLLLVGLGLLVHHYA